MVDEGADLLDIGGESTRPYSEPVSGTEELRHVIPVIEALHGKIGVPLSIDTSKAAVAGEAVAAGAEIINDITGLAGDREMLEVAASSAGVCAMHIQGTPQTMQDDPQYVDVVAEIHAWLAKRRRDLAGCRYRAAADLPRPRGRFRKNAPAQSDAAGRLRAISRSRLPAAGGLCQGLHRQAARRQTGRSQSRRHRRRPGLG